MKRSLFVTALLAFAAATMPARVITFEFGHDELDKAPPGFKNAVTGVGHTADWKVVQESVAPILAPIETNAKPNTAARSALTVQSFDVDDHHFPILLYTNEIFSDFTLTTRFKISGGIVEPSAGVIFRAQDASNYYVLRASTEGNLLWYRVVGGRGYENLGIGVQLPFEKNRWRELKVQCSGSQFRCYLDGKLVIPPVRPGAPADDPAINDTTFARGMIGFWSKADTKSYFIDTQVDYTPRVPYLQVAINNVLKKHPSILSLDVYAHKTSGMPTVIGSMNQGDMGAEGTKVESDVLAHGSVYYLKKNRAAEVTLPLRDRNGDIVGALKVKIKSFRGETEATATTRAVEVKKDMELEIQTMQDING